MNEHLIKKHAKNVLEKVMRKTWKFHEKGSQKESQNPLKIHKKTRSEKKEVPPGLPAERRGTLKSS